jgi:hypothetical protein
MKLGGVLDLSRFFNEKFYKESHGYAFCTENNIIFEVWNEADITFHILIDHERVITKKIGKN